MPEIHSARTPEQIAELDRIQERAIGECLEGLEHDRSVLLEAPTGAGKTRISAQVVDRFAHDFEARHGRKPYVLALQHSQDLAGQSAKKFSENAPGSTLTTGVSLNGHMIQNCDVNYAVIDTVASHLAELRTPDFVLIDEAHHAVADAGAAGKNGRDKACADYPKVLDHILAKNPRCVFMSQTATPGRPDNSSLHPVVANAPNATIGYYELERAGQILIPDTIVGKIGMRPYESIGKGDPGYSQNLEQFVASAVLDAKGDHDRIGALLEANRPGGKSREGYREFIEESFNQWDRRFRSKFPEDKLPGTIVFESNIDKARMFYEHAMSEGVKVAIVHSAATRDKDPNSFDNADDAISAYAQRKYDMIVSVKKLDEGVDAPRTRCVLLNRRTTSSVEYHQMAGRAMRMGNDPELFAVKPVVIDNGASTQMHGTIRDRGVVIDYIQGLDHMLRADIPRPIEQIAKLETGKPLDPATFSLWKKVNEDPEVYGITDGKNAYYAINNTYDTPTASKPDDVYIIRQLEEGAKGKSVQFQTRPIENPARTGTSTSKQFSGREMNEFERDLARLNRLAIQKAEASRPTPGGPTVAEATLTEERRLSYITNLARAMRSNFR